MPYKDRNSPEARASRARVKAKALSTPEGRRKAQEHILRYRSTEKGRVAKAALNKAYVNTPEGRAAVATGHAKRMQDPLYALRWRLRTRLSKALRRIKSGKPLHATNALEQHLGCTLPEFAAFIEAQFTSDMTWANHGTHWHLDHVVALGRFSDLSDPAQLRQAAHYTNLQPLKISDHELKTKSDLRLIRGLVCSAPTMPSL